MEHLKCDFDFRLVYENGVMDFVRYVPAGEGGSSEHCVVDLGKYGTWVFIFFIFISKFSQLQRKVSDVLPEVCVGPLKSTYYSVQLNS
jgi:hypothetical protein